MLFAFVPCFAFITIQQSFETSVLSLTDISACQKRLFAHMYHSVQHVLASCLIPQDGQHATGTMP